MRLCTRLIELGVHVTKIEIAKTKLVLRYASLMGSILRSRALKRESTDSDLSDLFRGAGVDVTIVSKRV